MCIISNLENLWPTLPNILSWERQHFCWQAWWWPLIRKCRLHWSLASRSMSFILIHLYSFLIFSINIKYLFIYILQLLLLLLLLEVTWICVRSLIRTLGICFVRLFVVFVWAIKTGFSAHPILLLLLLGTVRLKYDINVILLKYLCIYPYYRTIDWMKMERTL